MEQAPKPLENQKPQGDQMLEALERSIENPKGLEDTLAKHDQQFEDNLARQLDELEASIENASSRPHEAKMVPDGELTTVENDGSLVSDAVSGDDLTDTLEVSEDISDERTKSQLFPRPHRRGGSRLRGRRRHLSTRRGLGTVRRRIVRRQGNKRFCPDTHEVINKRECESCEKYRHWPEGTDEEPRECWYDWQAKGPCDKSDNGIDEGR